ncbi:hypothetical protein DH2020_043682 [Rehmannia glutinosa]|uniref:CCHC-type domain-containing protein n=1 Tax=Rehmannia glutinosa TaxID=99300 RepID=A0ABR0UIY3_REHGL
MIVGILESIEHLGRAHNLDPHSSTILKHNRTTLIPPWTSITFELRQWQLNLQHFTNMRNKLPSGGSRQEIQKQLLSVETNTYDVVVRAAARVESGLSRLESQLKVNISNTKKSFAGQTSKKPQQFLKGGVKDFNGKGKHGQILVCSYCNKPGHTPEECWRKAGKCLRCGSGQHQVKDCPMAV